MEKNIPMVNEKELEIRDRLIKLLKPQIEDEEIFCKEFGKSIFFNE